MTLTITRELTVEVAHNIRHIGGYRTVAGRTTSEQIIRSAGLQRLTPAGVQALADRGVATIVDLRSTVERERDVPPDVSGNGIEHIFAPVFEQPRRRVPGVRIGLREHARNRPRGLPGVVRDHRLQR